MGPARKPEEIRQGHRRLVAREIGDDPTAEVPPLPKSYEKPVRQAWRRFWRSPVSQAVDRGADLAALHRWAWNLNEFHKVAPIVQSARLVKGSTGQPSLNPLATYLATLQTAIKEAEREFGMTPMARLRLGIAYGQARLTAAALNREIDDELSVASDDETAKLQAEFEKGL